MEPTVLIWILQKLSQDYFLICRDILCTASKCILVTEGWGNFKKNSNETLAKPRLGQKESKDSQKSPKDFKIVKK